MDTGIDSTAADRQSSGDRLKITEIFFSLQGEADSVGWPTVFVRLTGCPLRCHYCDTAYAFHGGQWMSIDQIAQQVAEHRSRRVTVTGGEPLAQKRCLQLLTKLCDEGYQVSLETSGALAIDQVDQRVSVVMDLKTPASGEGGRNLWANVQALGAKDQVKFVLCSRQDYQWARQVVADQAWPEGLQILFSPSYGQLQPRDLADWILADRLDVRFQMQLHKQLWGDEPGR